MNSKCALDVIKEMTEKIKNAKNTCKVEENEEKAEDESIDEAIDTKIFQNDNYLIIKPNTPMDVLANLTSEPKLDDTINKVSELVKTGPVYFVIDKVADIVKYVIHFASKKFIDENGADITDWSKVPTEIVTELKDLVSAKDEIWFLSMIAGK